MPCLLTSGFTSDCLEGAGGVKEVFFQNWEDFSAGITFDGTTGEVDALPEATLYRYVPLKNSASWSDAAVPSQENGTLFFTQTITLRLSGLSMAKRNEILNLSKAKVIAFVRTMQDQIWIIGRQTGLYLSTGTSGTGAARGDFNGYELTMTADEPLMAEKLEAYTSVPFDNFADITVSPAYPGVS
jgi:hypothetical protein